MCIATTDLLLIERYLATLSYSSSLCPLAAIWRSSHVLWLYSIINPPQHLTKAVKTAPNIIQRRFVGVPAYCITVKSSCTTSWS